MRTEEEIVATIGRLKTNLALHCGVRLLATSSAIQTMLWALGYSLAEANNALKLLTAEAKEAAEAELARMEAEAAAATIERAKFAAHLDLWPESLGPEFERFYGKKN